MKIKDKRSAFFMLTSMQKEMSVAYLDEVDFRTLKSYRPSDLSGSSVFPNYIEKVDAGRTLLIFTTSDRDHITEKCLITSSSGTTYTAVKINYSCVLIPGIKRGDFAQISFE